jgi:hypothetical protein
MEAGKYSGRIAKSKVDTTKNGCIQFVAALCLTKFEGDPLPAPYTPVAYMPLTKTNGERNTSQIDSIMAALGWNGVSLKELNAKDWSNIDIEAIMTWDEYNGQSKLRVSWINAPGSTPTLKPTDPKLIDEMDAFWNGKGQKPAAREVPAKAERNVTGDHNVVDEIPESEIPF